MSVLPKTRHTLLVRLREVADHEAWSEFVELYELGLYRYVKSRGLQDADAWEVVQEVLLAVHRSIAKWQDGPEDMAGFLAYRRREPRSIRGRKFIANIGGSHIRRQVPRVGTDSRGSSPGDISRFVLLTIDACARCTYLSNAQTKATASTEHRPRWCLRPPLTLIVPKPWFLLPQETQKDTKTGCSDFSCLLVFFVANPLANQ